MPVVAFVVEADSPDDSPEVATATGDSLAGAWDFRAGLSLPDGRITADGYDYPNARAFIAACKSKAAKPIAKSKPQAQAEEELA